jgi:hypothetical protein
MVDLTVTEGRNLVIDTDYFFHGIRYLEQMLGANLNCRFILLGDLTSLEFTGIVVSFFTGSTAPLGPGLCFQFYDHFTDGRTFWTSDQLVARPLPKHRTTHAHTPNIHALCEIRTHEPSLRASEDSTCLRPLGYCDRRNYGLPSLNSHF